MAYMEAPLPPPQKLDFPGLGRLIHPPPVVSPLPFSAIKEKWNRLFLLPGVPPSFSFRRKGSPLTSYGGPFFTLRVGDFPFFASFTTICPAYRQGEFFPRHFLGSPPLPFSVVDVIPEDRRETLPPPSPPEDDADPFFRSFPLRQIKRCPVMNRESFPPPLSHQTSGGVFSWESLLSCQCRLISPSEREDFSPLFPFLVGRRGFCVEFAGPPPPSTERHTEHASRYFSSAQVIGFSLPLSSRTEDVCPFRAAPSATSLQGTNRRLLFFLPCAVERSLPFLARAERLFFLCVDRALSLSSSLLSPLSVVPACVQFWVENVELFPFLEPPSSSFLPPPKDFESCSFFSAPSNEL